MKSISFALLCLLLFSACSKVKKAEENMDNMNKQTMKMSTTTDEMKDTTGTMYQQIRSKEAEDTRAAKFQELLDSKVDMGGKFTAACVFFKSFEFQLWTGNGSFDSTHARMSLYLDAVNEFTRRITDVYKKIKPHKISPTKSGKKHNHDMAFYAIAATMHFNHHYQEEMGGKAGIPVVSFYDIIKQALLKEINGMNLEEHEEVLLSGMNREIVIELIKARVDMLSALALNDLTDKRKMGLKQKAKGLLYKATFGWFGSIDLPETYDHANMPTKDRIITYLDGAVSAKNFLRELGVSKNLDGTLKSAFINIDFNEKSSGNSKKEDDKKEEIRDLISKILE